MKQSRSDIILLIGDYYTVNTVQFSTRFRSKSASHELSIAYVAAEEISELNHSETVCIRY